MPWRPYVKKKIPRTYAFVERWRVTIEAIGLVIVFAFLAWLGLAQYNQGATDKKQNDQIGSVTKVIKQQSNCIPRRGESGPRHPKLCKKGFDQAVKTIDGVQACRIVRKAIPYLYINGRRIKNIECRRPDGTVVGEAPGSSEMSDGMSCCADTQEGQGNAPVAPETPSEGSNGDNGTDNPPPDSPGSPGGGGTNTPSTPDNPTTSQPAGPTGPTGASSILTVPDVSAGGITIHVPCTTVLGTPVANCRVVGHLVGPNE